MRLDVILPYEPNYCGHREAEAKHTQTKLWLRERERLLAMKDIRKSTAVQDSSAVQDNAERNIGEKRVKF